jgi:hypothetical protein
VSTRLRLGLELPADLGEPIPWLSDPAYSLRAGKVITIDPQSFSERNFWSENVATADPRIGATLSQAHQPQLPSEVDSIDVALLGFHAVAPRGGKVAGLLRIGRAMRRSRPLAPSGSPKGSVP